MKLGVVRVLALFGVVSGLGCGGDEGCPVGLVRDSRTRSCLLPSQLPPPATGTGGMGQAGAGGLGEEGGAGGMGMREMPVTIQGVILDALGTPIVGMAISLTAPGTQTVAATVLTTPDGSFNLTSVINGSSANLFLKLDGSSALGGANFPVVNRRVTVIGGQMTTLAPVFLPVLNTGIDLSTQPGLTVEPASGGGLSVSAPQGLVVSFPSVGEPSVVGVAPPGGFPGDLADNSQVVVTFPVGATLSFPPGFDPSMSLTGIPTDRTPFDLSPMSAPSDIIALEPAGAEVGGGSVQVTLPNRQNLPPGTELDLFKVDPDSGQFNRTDGAQAGEHDAKVVPICNDPGDDPDPAAGAPCPTSGVRQEQVPRMSGPGGPILFATRPMTRIRIKRPVRRLGTLALQCPASEVTGRATLQDGTPIPGGTVRFQQVGEDGQLHLLPVSTTTDADGRFSIMLPACADAQLRIVIEKQVDSPSQKAGLAVLAALPVEETTVKVSDLRNVEITGDFYYLVDVEVRISSNEGAATTLLEASPCVATRPGQCTAVARHPLAASRDKRFQYTRLDGQILDAPNGAMALARFHRLPVLAAMSTPVPGGNGNETKRAGSAASDVMIRTARGALAKGHAPINFVNVSAQLSAFLADTGSEPSAQFGGTRMCFATTGDGSFGFPQLTRVGSSFLLTNGFGDHTSFGMRFNQTLPVDSSFLSLPGNTNALVDFSLDGPGNLLGDAQLDVVNCTSSGFTRFGSLFINLQQHIQCGQDPIAFVPPPVNSTNPQDEGGQPSGNQPSEPKGPCAAGETERHLSSPLVVAVGRPPEGLLPPSTPRIPVPGAPPPGMTPPDITPGQRPPSVAADSGLGRGKLLDRHIFRVNDTSGAFKVWRIDCDKTSRACEEILVGAGTSPGFVRDVTFFGAPPSGLGILTSNGNAYVATLSGAAYSITATLPLDAQVTSAERIVSGDFDGDTFQDLAVSVNTVNSIAVWRGTASASTFNASMQSVAAPVLGIQGAPLSFGAGPTAPGMIVVVLPGATANLGPRVVTLSGAAFTQRTVQLANSLSTGASIMDTRDYNGDGFTDVVVIANNGTGAVGDFAFGSGGGNIFNPGRSFQGVRSSALRLGVSSLTRRLAPPFDDRDADTDVVAGVAGGVEMLEQVAAGVDDNGFVPLGLRPHQIGIADYDSDGQLDVGAVTDRQLGDQPEGLTHWVAHISSPAISLATTPTADPRPYLVTVFPGAAKPGATVTLGGVQLSPLSHLVLVDSRGQVREIAAASAASDVVTFVVPDDAAPGRHAAVLITESGIAKVRFRVLPR